MIKVKILAVATLLIYIGLSANSSNELTMTTKLLQEVSQGSTQLKPLSEAIPGNVVVYEHTISNASSTIAKDLVITDIVPKHTTYVIGSAEGKGCDIAYSVDGEVYDTPSQLFVYSASTLRVANPKEYKHIKWTCTELKPHSQKVLRFKTKID